MRPAHKTISAGRLDGSRAGLFHHFEAALSREHPNLILRTIPFAEAKSDSQLLFIPKEERYISMSKKLYVGNLAFQTTNLDLQQLFGQAGTVESAQIIEDRDTGRSKGFAFVEMSTEAEAASAIDQFNGKEVAGRMLKVNEAKPRENRSGGGGGRNFGGGYGGNRNGGGNHGRRSEPRW
jgi:RNA recognition motif-containing protein